MESTEGYDGLRFLESLGRWEKGHFSPLEVPRKILNTLNNPQDDVPTIHIAGTNGKGTTGAFISSILKEAGFKVGHFSSPHLYKVTERCRINGGPISSSKFNDAVSELAEVVNWDSSQLSYFVATAIASFLCFKREAVDFNVIEVGLGGSLDATNLIEKPRYNLITSVSLDHQEVLGDSVEEIAKNKAGIIKKGSEVFVGKLPQVALDIVKQKVLQVGACFSELNYTGDCQLSGETLEINFAHTSFRLKAESEFLKSAYVHDCVLLALRVCRSLGVANEIIASGVEKTYWPARMEQIHLASGGQIILDGAHNLEAFEALFSQVEKIARREGIKNIHLVLAMRKRSGFENCISLIHRKILEFREKSFDMSVSCPPWDDALALDRDEWERSLSGVVVNYHSQPKLIVESMASNDDGKQLIVVTGSLHFVAKTKGSL